MERASSRLVVVPLRLSRVLFAVGIALGFYLVFCRAIMKGLPFTRETWLARVLVDDVNINLGSYIAFAIAMVVLFDRYKSVTMQESALDSDLLSSDDNVLVLPEDALSLRRRLREREPGTTPSIPLQLLDAGLQRARVNWSAPDVGEAVKTRADTIQGQIDTEYSLVRYLAWAIPSIGFIGTVYGLGNAIGAMRVVEGAEKSYETRMEDAIKNLFTAFDTTLIALILSIVLMFTFHWVQAKEDSLLVNSVDWCMRRFVLRMHAKEQT